MCLVSPLREFSKNFSNIIILLFNVMFSPIHICKFTYILKHISKIDISATFTHISKSVM